MNKHFLIQSSLRISESSGDPNTDQHAQWSAFWRRKFLQGLLDSIRTNESSYYLRTILKPYLHKDRFIELGCGTAIQLAMLAGYYKELIALDYSKESLDIARQVLDARGVKNYKITQQDIRDIKNIRADYDVVFSNGLIEHFKEPWFAIESHLRYAKPGGFVIILAPSAYLFKHLWFKITDNVFLKRLWPWTEQCFFTKKSMEETFDKVDKNLVKWHEVKELKKVENIALIIQKK
ncbi:MAG: class I SAM-dependent methyltransferase [Candidatus Roizmanbacteria bacterium]